MPEVKTVCGAAPGPHCFGCYAHEECGSDDSTFDDGSGMSHSSGIEDDY